MRVLVAEDARQLAEAVADGLRGQAMAVDVVFDGQAAQESLAVNDYDVVILDRDLPLVHGDEVCRSLAAGGATVRILMLTAAGDLSERVTGLNLGADDYLIKPFAFAELVARVRALGRRARPADPPVLERAGIRLDPGPPCRRHGMDVRCRCGTRSSSSWKNSCAAEAPWCPPSSSSRRRGMRISTRSRTLSASRS